MKKRICIFSFAWNSETLSDDDLYKLKELKNLSQEIISIVPNETSPAVKNELSGYVSEVIPCDDMMPSICFDTGINRILEKYSQEDFDEIVFLDNSFYGPFNGFKEIFEVGEHKFIDSDFWGIWGIGKKTDANVFDSFCIHSSFLALKKKLFTSPALYEYCGSLKNNNNVDCFQKTFTSFFMSRGFGADCIFFSDEDRDGYGLLRLGAPIIAKTFFSASFSDVISSEIASNAKAAVDFIEKNTAYNTDMIYQDLIGFSDPFNLLSLLGNHFIVDEYREVRKIKDAAIVFHMHYEDQMDENLQRLNTVAAAVDVIITTTSKKKADEIAEKANQFSFLNESLVLVSEGNGRDMAALLVEARPYLRNYKYIGFTHDKKSAHHRKESGDGFKRIIIENIIASPEYVCGIIDLFQNNRRLGLLVPPAPEHEKYFAVTGRRWAANFSYYQALCQKLNIEATADPRWSSFALGTAFWCRYDALKELFEYDWCHSDFPSEPLPLNGSISHAMERGFPYIAKKNNYYSGIIYNREFASMYLNGREYMLTDLMTLMNGRLSADGLTFNEYKKKISDNFAADLASLREAKRVQKKKIRTIQRSEYFDRKWYISQYPEVKKMKMSPAEHYLMIGWKEERFPSEEFSDAKFIPVINDAVSNGVNPLYFYETNLKLKHSIGAYNDGDYRPHRFIRNIKRKLGLFLCADAVRKNKNARVLVILHLFYMSSWKEIKEYLHNLDVYNYRLIVTYTSDIIDNKVLGDIKRYKPEAVLREYPNLGYDVGSFTDVLTDIDTADYDIIFKLQSKGVKRPQIFIYGQYFKKRDWFLNLYEGCIGAFTVHKTIDKLMNDNSIGLVGAKNLVVADPVHKQNMVKAFMKEQGINIPQKYLYVAGTCFAARSVLMQPIKEMDLKIHNYRFAGRSFSLAHKMERLICLVVLNAGCDFYGNNVLVLRRFFRKLAPGYHRRKKYIGIRLLSDKRFILDDEFVYFNLEHRLVKKYEIVQLPLKDIKRSWMGEITPLTESMPYKYLQTKDSAIYDEYCRLNKEFYNLDIMSKERFNSLIKSIEENGFESQNIIVVNGDNIIADGQHRCCYMLYKYGEDYKVPCLKIYDLVPIGKVKDFLKRHLSEENFERLKRIYHRFV